MRHVTAGTKSVLTGDLVSELLMRYATLLIQQRTADSVELNGYDGSGTRTVVAILLNDGISLVAEQLPTDLAEPGNAAAERYLQSRIDVLMRQQEPPWDDIAGVGIWGS